MLAECIDNKSQTKNDDYEKELLAYAASYISLTKEGNFVIATEDFLSNANIQKITHLVSEAI